MNRSLQSAVPAPPVEVFYFDPAMPPAEAGRSQVLWGSPGSLALEEVAAAWAGGGGNAAQLAKISGPWGVVLWDAVRAEYVVSTDPVGVMPVFWSRTADGRIAVASWLAQLVDSPAVDDRLDYEGILLDQIPSIGGEAVLHRTRFAAVEQVPWGRILRVDRGGGTHLVQYWDPRALPPPDDSLSLAESAELLRARIDASVRRLTPTSATVGAHVSGGLDCTSVACRTNQVLAERGSRLVAGYSWAPSRAKLPELPRDERRLLDEVSAAEGFGIRSTDPSPIGDWFFELDRNRYASSTHGRERMVLSHARADGVEVMVSGWGGDELASFNGRGVTADLVRRGKWRQVWRQTGQRQQVLARAGLPPGSRLRAVASAVGQGLPSELRPGRTRRAAVGRPASPEAIAQLRANSELAADARSARLAAIEELASHHDWQLHLLTNGHLQHRTRWWYQTGRLQGIHYRYPLLDVGVITAALSLPWWAFRSQGWTRLAFRRAIEPWVPAGVAWNPTKDEPAIEAGSAEAQAGPMIAQGGFDPSDPQLAEVLELASKVR